MMNMGGVNKNENILESNKDLSVIGIFEDDPETKIKVKAKNWIEIESLYQLLLNGKINELKEVLSNMSDGR